MEPVVLSAQCSYTVPRSVILQINGPDGIVYTVAFNEAQYKVLALLPIFPPNPCEK